MEQNVPSLTEEISLNSIDKYKASLFKLWKQACEKKTIKINVENNIWDVKNKIVDLNTKDNYVNNFLKETFDNNIVSNDFTNHEFFQSCYYFNIDKKKLSISKMVLEVHVGKKYTYTKKSKKLFSSGFNETSHNFYLGYTTSPNDVANFFNPKSGDRLRVKYYKPYSDSCSIKVIIPLLTYNNIFIPISFDEFETLRCYELECRKKDDMEDVYRHLTLLTPSEYKEFIMWKESQKIYEIKDNKE